MWGTICDDNFGPEEGAVACRMLGFENSQAILHSHGTFLPGTGPIWIDDIQCIGTELNLKDCITANTWQHSYNCKHLEDVNIECIPLNFRNTKHKQRHQRFFRQSLVGNVPTDIGPGT